MNHTSIQVTKKALSEALNLLERIVQSRSSNPILSYLKLSATERGLLLCGTNLELDLEAFVTAQVSQDFSTVVPAHLFAQIVRNLSNELVELSLQGSELHISGGSFKTKLQTGDLDAYPEIVFPSASDSTLDARELARSLSSVRYAAATEAFQAVFRGIKLELKNTRARVVASDGFRLALRDFGEAGIDRNLILPAKAADELSRIFKDGEVKLTFGNSLLTVASDRLRLNLKLMDGEFPDYERVIPAAAKLSVRLSAARLKESLKRVELLADKTANNRVEFQVSESTLQLIAEGDSGRAQDALEVEQGGSELAMTLAFNAKYVSDALGPIENEVLIEFSGPATPAMFRAVDDSGYLAVVVPLRV